jgi:hypothetical protein
MTPLFRFFLIHLTCFAALVLNIGFKKDGYAGDSKKKPPGKKRIFLKHWGACRPHGKISILLLLVSLAAALVFLFHYRSYPNPNFTYLYLGYLITVLLWTMPFFSDSSILKPEVYEDKIPPEKHTVNPFRPNLLGIMLLVLGLLSFLSTILMLITKNQELVTGYIAILGYGMTLLTAVVGILGESRDKATGKITDFGKASITFFLIFFLISVINAGHQDKQRAYEIQGIMNKVDSVDTSLHLLQGYIDTGIFKRTKKINEDLTKFDNSIENRGFARSKQIDSIRNIQLTNLLRFDTALDEMVAKSSILQRDFKTADSTLEVLNRQDTLLGEKISRTRDSIDSVHQHLKLAIDEIDTTRNREFRIEHALPELSKTLNDVIRGVDTLKKGRHKDSLNIDRFETATKTNIKIITDSLHRIDSMIRKQHEQTALSPAH